MAREFLESTGKFLSDVTLKYRSPFDMGKKNAIFCENPWGDDGEAEGEAAKTTLRPVGAACGDSLWSAAHIAHDVCVAAGNLTDMVAISYRQSFYLFIIRLVYLSSSLLALTSSLILKL